MAEHRIKMDEEVYASMLDFLQHNVETNKPGTETDMAFILDDFWLQDSVVIENVEKHHGTWNVFLVFAYQHQPLKLIKRKITHFVSEQKAVLSAHYMRRLAAKDQRGTIRFNDGAVKVNHN
jgi:hypothetical protein